MLLLGAMSFGMEFEFIEYSKHEGGKMWNSKCSENKICVKEFNEYLKYKIRSKQYQ